MAIKKVKLKNMSGDQLIPDVGIPSQTGNNGKVLGTNGSSLQFVDMPTVTSTYTATGTDAVNGMAVSNAIATKQDNLVSGTNIKTVNGTSLLGSGNIDIQGGGSSYTAGTGIDITNNVISAKIATSVSSTSTNADAVGAKLFYDTVGDIEAALHTINSGSNNVIVSIYATGRTISDAIVTIGDETFTNLVAGTTYTFEANKNESYTLRLQCSGYAVAIRDSNGNVLIGYPNTSLDDVSYTFEATSDITFQVYSDIEIT